MFLPVGDTPNPVGFRAWVNWALMGLNVAIYVLISLPLSGTPVDPADPALRDWVQSLAPHGIPVQQLLAGATAYDLFTFAWGYKPAAPQVGDLFASMFLHGGFLHLAGNMLMLWIYGDNIEHRLGRLPYLLVYLGSGAAATLFYAAFAADSMVPLVGASGAISGVLGMYFLWFPRNRVKLFVAFFPFFLDVLLVPARLVLGVFVVIDNLLPILVGGGGGVAYGAHLGGFAAGLGVAFVADRLGFGLQGRTRRRVQASRGRFDVVEGEARPAEYRHAPPENRRVARARGELAAARMWLAEGYPVTAYQHLVNAVRLDPEGAVGQEARALIAELPGLHRRR